MIQTTPLNQQSRGGNHKPVVVATAEEMVQILWALPGTNEFRKNCADVVVSYLGGDPRQVERVFRNRQAQEQMAVAAPGHPARIFGQAVEASSVQVSEATTIEEKMGELIRKSVNEAESRLMESLREEWQRATDVTKIRITIFSLV